MSAEPANPIFIDLGSKKKSKIKKLKRGEGKARGEIERVIESVRAELATEADGKVLVPIVIIYRQKPKRRRLFDGKGIW